MDIQINRLKQIALTGIPALALHESEFNALIAKELACSARRSVGTCPNGRSLLIEYAFDACEQATGQVSSQSLVRYQTNDYSVPSPWPSRCLGTGLCRSGRDRLRRAFVRLPRRCRRARGVQDAARRYAMPFGPP
jgi:hypothetical protein